jgi:hypothetical protein
MSHWHRGQAGQRDGASYEALTGASTPTIPSRPTTTRAYPPMTETAADLE